MPSGAAHCAQEALYPAGTRGDIQVVSAVVTVASFKFVARCSALLRLWLYSRCPGAVLPSDQLGSGVVASCLARRWLRCPVLVAAVASLPGALHGSHSVTGSGFVCRAAVAS